MIYKLLSIICASSLPFLFSLDGDFVFDDSEAIVTNKDVFSGSWINVFNNDFWGTSIKSNLSHKSYRPLTVLSFRANYYLNNNKLSARQFKVTNLFLHITSCILLWKMFESILTDLDIRKRGANTAHLATLLFAVHPAHVESVCGIVGRADILAAITFFLGFLSYRKSVITSKLSYLYLFNAIMFATASMMFKENGITVLGFCISYELILPFKNKNHNHKNSQKSSSNRRISRMLCTLIAIFLLLYGRWIVMEGTKPEFKPIDNPAAFADNIFTKVATYNYIYFINFVILLWPQWLCYDWSMGCLPLLRNILDYRILFIVSMYAFGLLILLALLNNKNKICVKRVIFLSVLLAIIPFLPASNIFYPVGFVVAERILYIPSAGYCLFVATGYNKLAQREKIKRYKISNILFYLLLIVFALRSWQRSKDWCGEYHLFSAGLSVCPLNAKVHYNIAKVADAKHHTEWALQEYKEAIRLYPEYYQAMNNLANLLKNQKQYNEAEFYLRTAVDIKKDFPAAWMNLGIVLASMKRYNESEAAYKTALEYRRNYPDCLYNLGNLYLELNKTVEAMENWLSAVNLNSTHVLAWTNLLALLDNTGQIEKALQLIPEVLAQIPDMPSINFAIANIYGKMDRFAEAEQYFKKAIALFDTKVQAIHYANLGVLYHRWKKYLDAGEMYKAALKINPMFKSAQKNLASLQKYIKQ